MRKAFKIIEISNEIESDILLGQRYYLVAATIQNIYTLKTERTYITFDTEEKCKQCKVGDIIER